MTVRKKILSITLFIQITFFIALLGSFTKSEIVQARDSFQEVTPQPFLGAIYYGRRTVTNVFDHSFPGDSDNNDYVIHYDGSQHDPATNTPTAPEFTPEPGEWIRNGYGYSRHLGIDYNLMYRPVLAAAEGAIEVAGWSQPDNHRLGYGLHVVMSHFDNPDYQTWYGHFSSLTVQTGDEINFGEWNNPADRRRILGISGNTGNVFGTGGGCPNVEDEYSCGYHLHFEVRRNGIVVNPYGWIAVGIDGTITPDPWNAHQNGAKSDNLWSTRPAIATRPATSSSQYPDGFILTEPDTPLPYITVDNADEEHYSQTTNDPNNPNECMIEETGGYNGTFHRAQAINDGEGTPTCTVRWTITPPDGITPNDDGYYELYAYIPETTLTLSRGAIYNIWHTPENGGPLQRHQAIAVQAVFPNDDYENNDNWVYLGRYHFTLDGTEYVELNNATFDGDDNTFFVAADAIQLSVDTLPPTNTPTPTPTTPSTPSPTGTPTPAGTPTPLPPSAAYITKIGSGGKNPAISGNGQFVAYYSNSGDIMRYDHATQQNEMVVDSSFGYDKRIAISDDGNYIAYVALGPYHDDIFLYDHNAPEAIQNLTDHAQDSTINVIQYWDIRIVQSESSVLVGYTERIVFSGSPHSQIIWLYDSAQDTPTAIDPGVGMARYLHDISADGNELLVRNEQTIYVYTLVPSYLQRISPIPNPQGMGGADFSSNGRYVVYNSYSFYCPPCRYNRDVYWYDRNTPTATPEGIFSDSGNTADNYARVSDNGRYIFYLSGLDIYRYDRDVGGANRITIPTDSSENLNGSVNNLETSNNGRFVTFSSTASNLVANDSNNAEDVFLADTDLLTNPPPTPTATPNSPSPTPTAEPTCFVGRLLLTSNDANNSGVAHQDGINNASVQAPINQSLLQQGRQFLGKMLQTADMLTLLYRLRDDVMSQTETGLYYTDLYYTHSDELTDLVEADPVLFQEAHDTLLLFQPHLEDFLDGDGNSVTVTAAEVQAVQSLLDQFAALGSPALQQTIAAEQARLPLAQFIGKTSNEVWASLPPPPVTPAAIARDGLEPEWANWSWGTASLDLCATAVVHTGSCAVAVDLNAWGGLSFHHDDFATDDWDVLTFQIHGGSSGGQQLWVYLAGQPAVSLNNSAYLESGAVAANAWKQVTIPLADLGGADTVINRLSIQAVGEQPPFYVDEMQLEGSIGLPTPTPTSTPSPMPTATATLIPTHTPQRRHPPETICLSPAMAWNQGGPTGRGEPPASISAPQIKSIQAVVPWPWISTPGAAFLSTTMTLRRMTGTRSPSRFTAAAQVDSSYGFT